jgi:hypothetical protein
MAVAIHAVAIIAIGFRLNSRSFLTSGPNFIIIKASKKNFIPWLINVAVKKMHQQRRI